MLLVFKENLGELTCCLNHFDLELASNDIEFPRVRTDFLLNILAFGLLYSMVRFTSAAKCFERTE